MRTSLWTARRTGYIGRALCAAVVLVGAPRPTWAVTSLGDLTGPWQLFADDHLVADRNGVTRTYHPFQKYAGNPIIPANKPWEGNNIYVYGTILPNESGNGYRLWYHALPTDVKYRLCYATSTNGISWTKPNLNIVTYNGSTANNIFLARSGQDHIPSILHTPWETDPGRRYKLINFDGAAGRFLGAWSSDGLHWTDSPANPIIPPASDVGNYVWDAHADRYVGYMKIAAYVRGLRRRAVGFTSTTDFEAWPAPYLVMAPDAYDDRWATGEQRTHFYGLCGFPYQSMYIGFLWVFRATDAGGYTDGPIFVEIVTSRDGIHWRREEGDRPAMLPLGPPGAWDDGMIFTTQQPVVVGDTLRVYYGGVDGTHGGTNGHSGIGLATLRKDGFASLDAGGTTGVITTKRLQGAGGALHVNYATTGGSIRVEVLDPDGNVLPGYSQAECVSLQGNSVDQVVTWASRSELPGGAEPVRLRFVLQNAALYSFMAGSGIQILDEPPGPVGGVLCTFEKDIGATLQDRWRPDGTQALAIQGDVIVDRDPAAARFGGHSLAFGPGTVSANVLQIGGTSNLGTAFTLAAMVRSDNNRHARLFSTKTSAGAANASELVFDFDPTGTAVPGLQLACKGIVAQSLPRNFMDGQYHHLAATYNDGDVRFYLDGAAAGQAWLPGGDPVLLLMDLRAGSDPTEVNAQQFIGRMDDVLVLRRVLSADEVMTLAQSGAGVLFGIVDLPPDFDGDADVDLQDFSVFQYCFSGPNRPPVYSECPRADFDGDLDVDLADFATLQGLFNGPNRAPSLP